MAEYKWNIGIYQADSSGSDYKWNIGIDQDDGEVTPSYVDAEASLSGTGTLSAVATVVEVILAEASLSGVGTLLAVGRANIRTVRQATRLIAVGNNQVFYEQI